MDGKREIKVGDTLQISIRRIEREDWDLKPNLRQEKYIFYCDGRKILEEDESFYKSENLKGLRIVD
ncbi:MAG: hypothetical protein MUF68_08255 [Cyclobacteriaceae bacterium]|jgi:hypothetical protein|nr:hypothetical protein [Cyclobacteriaceae bacterium]